MIDDINTRYELKKTNFVLKQQLNVFHKNRKEN